MRVRVGEYPRSGRESLDAIWELAAAGTIRPRIHATYPLDRWHEAFTAMAASDVIGKLVLTP